MKKTNKKIIVLVILFLLIPLSVAVEGFVKYIELEKWHEEFSKDLEWEIKAEENNLYYSLKELIQEGDEKVTNTFTLTYNIEKMEYTDDNAGSRGVVLSFDLLTSEELSTEEIKKIVDSNLLYDCKCMADMEYIFYDDYTLILRINGKEVDKEVEGYMYKEVEKADGSKYMLDKINWEYSDGSIKLKWIPNVAWFWSVVFILAIVVMKIQRKFKKTRDAVKEKAEKAREEAEKAREESARAAELERYNKESKEIYKYYEKNLFNIKDQETNEVVSNTKNIPVDKLIEMYNCGKDILAKEEIAKMEEKIRAAIEKEKAKYEEQKANAELFGKDKYLSVLNDRIDALDGMQKLSSIMSESYISGAIQARKTQKSDPYILGGMANGIAGPAAGMMIASKIERENREREERGKQIAEASMESAREWGDKSYTYVAPLSRLKSVRDKINEALIITDIEKAQAYIKIASTKYEILDTKNFLVNIKLDLKHAKILDRNAIVDGAIKVNILDEENELIAEGYYAAKNISINNAHEANLEFGFNKYGNINVYCIALANSILDLNKKYKIEVNFINLWIMEDFGDNKSKNN